jgi:hypothetical protein
MKDSFVFPNFSFVIVIPRPSFQARAPLNCHAFHALSTALIQPEKSEITFIRENILFDYSIHKYLYPLKHFD